MRKWAEKIVDELGFKIVEQGIKATEVDAEINKLKRRVTDIETIMARKVKPLVVNGKKHECEVCGCRAFYKGNPDMILIMGDESPKAWYHCAVCGDTYTANGFGELKSVKGQRRADPVTETGDAYVITTKGK